MSDNSLDRILEELDDDNYNVSDEEFSLEDKIIPKDYSSEDDTTDDEPIQFRRVRNGVDILLLKVLPATNTRSV